MENKLREELLKLIKEIDSICKKYDITYFVEGGTAIGAIRHNGFIPWDDDIDIVMSRKNFNKFVEAFNNEKIPNRIIEYPEANKQFPVVTVKYTDTDTTSIFKSLFLDICAGGANIDIFILDPIPKGKEKWFKKNFLSYTELLCPYYIINNESSSIRYSIDLLKSKLFGKEKILNNYRKKLFNFDEEGNEEYLIRFGITYQTTKIEYYKEPRYYIFEDIMLPVPNKAEEILTNFFGDGWYYYPDVQDRDGHNVIQNFDVGYKYYKNDYMRFVDKKSFIDKASKLKYLRMKKKKRELYNSKNIHLLHASKDNILIKNNIKQDEVNKLFNDKKYFQLKEYSKLYIDIQGKSTYRKNNILIDLDLDIIIKILTCYIYLGEYYKITPILNLYKDNKKFIELKDTINKLRKAKLLYFDKQNKESLEIVNELLKKDKYNTSAFLIKLDNLMESKINNEECQKLIKEVEKYYNLTKNEELNKYLGDLNLKLNKKNEAIKYYNKALINNNNGLMILDIEKRMSKI